ncbi:MAG: hypothetical protein P3T54_07660 [Dehalogenimonas sp.]|uniref:Uncharacterized protein n=1 Tax=Candidatus Dehalogenimonas loeffleri TaxID=3127115 RepID=A0ABZ2J8R2_9CHLR|nr:hypothetical protein [Dehalogenimonas sp.]
MSYQTAEETALLLYQLLENSNQKRGRVSEATIRRLSGRTLLRNKFLEDLKGCLEDIGLILIELHRGGFGLMRASLLEGAPAITAKKYMKDELATLNNGVTNDDLFEKIRSQLEDPVNEADDS